VSIEPGAPETGKTEANTVSCQWNWHETVGCNGTGAVGSVAAGFINVALCAVVIVALIKGFSPWSKV
jgi:hypothetical protein